MVGTRHILGLAIDDAGVVATELSVQSGRAEVRRTGELLWGQELTADSARSLGQRLRQFLREQGFTSKRAVVGLAAKWVLTKEVDAPPASPEALAGMLSIQAERAFSLDAAARARPRKARYFCWPPGGRWSTRSRI
jgi:Tfp pilus assembly PilM family ATPase